MNATAQITRYIDGLADWRGKVIGQLRTLINNTAPALTEEWKWNTPVWSHNGNVVAVGVFQDHVKVNFFKGAMLNDSHGLFNAGLEAKASRALDIHEGDRIDAAALKDLVRAAVALNSGKPKRTQKRRLTPETKKRRKLTGSL
jgi:hypothetical protein